MTRVDIISGFLGAGKTTLIKKLLKEALAGQKVVLIENEFGEIGIDGGFLKEAGIQITEMNSGCICCSLVGDFGEAHKKVLTDYAPDRIIIEPSGVGKLSDVAAAVARVHNEVPELVLGSLTTVADAHKARIYMKNFGEFFNNQIEAAQAVILSRTGDMKQEKIEEAVALLREKNPTAPIVTTDWTALTGAQLLAVMDQNVSLADSLMAELAEADDDDDDDDEECECGHHHHHHHHHDEDEEHECCCGHHHHDDDDDDDDDDEDEHECHCGHHHHHHDEDEEHECCCGHHHHDDDDDDDDDEEEHECRCGHHHHHHHHHHDADEVFVSWGRETAKKFDESALRNLLEILADSTDYGIVLRAKGILPTPEGEWLHFDLVPGEFEVRHGAADYTGRLCVIGSQLKEEALEELFGL